MEQTSADATPDDTGEATEPRPNRRRLLRAAVAVPIGVIVAACAFGGGDEDDGDDEGEDEGGDD